MDKFAAWFLTVFGVGLTFLLTNYKDVKLLFASPAEYRIADDLRSFLLSKKVTFEETTNFKDAIAAGMRINACYYFSDGPADAGRQNAPAAWKGLSVEETAARLEQYSFEDRKSTRLNSSHIPLSRMPSSA